MYLLKEGEPNRFQDLVPLGEADWPNEVKDEICDFFARVGVADPMRQKLVEPSLSGVGFRNETGEVDWEDVVAYFKYEALSVLILQDKASREEAEKVYRDFFSGHKTKVRSRTEGS